MVPPLDEKPWPTLGPEVCDFLESYAVYGPGDLEGQPYVVSDEFRAQLYRAYEVYPHGHRMAGRRRFRQVSLEERKGTAKTERAMLIALAESHPEAPVRCDGWKRRGSAWYPVGRPMQRPYIPLVSYTVEQTEDLAYNVLRFIIENGPLVEDYDISAERILVLSGGRVSGKVVPLAGSPNSRDGALTTFQHFDEPHRMVLPRLKNAFTTMKENTYKRVGADAWTLTTSTAGEVGAQSVQEDIHSYAEAIGAGKVDDPRMFFFSRFAPDEMPLETPEDVMEFLLEASGPNAEWSGDLDALVARYFEPKTDRRYYRRVWGNQWVPGGVGAFDVARWKAQSDPLAVIEAGSLVVAGFHGSRHQDGTALVVTEVETGLVHLAGLWEPPAAGGEWEVPRDEVDAVLAALVESYDLWRMYACPTKWGPWIDAWAGQYGERRVVGWDTTRIKAYAYACRNLATAIQAAETPHTGDPRLTDHIANARRVSANVWDPETEEQLWRIAKERPESPRVISGAGAAVLAQEARNDCIAAGSPRSKRNNAAFFL